MAVDENKNFAGQRSLGSIPVLARLNLS